MYITKDKIFYCIVGLIVSTQFSLISTLKAQELEEVLVTATRGSLSSADSISSVSVVNSERLRELQPTIITDALQGAPGVFIQQTTPGQGTAIVRGLKGSEILHLVDGMRLNNALFRNAPNQYLALVDPWIIERTEVVRGPLSSLYGSDAMGGVVHLMSGRPDFMGEEFTTQSRVRLSFDSSTLGESINASTAIGNEDFSSGIALSYSDHGDLRAANRRAQTPTAFRSNAASFFVRYEDSKMRDWDFSIQYLEQPDTPRYDELVAGFGQSEPASEQFSFSPNSRLFLHGVHRSSGYSSLIDDLEIHLGLQKMRDGRRTQDTGSEHIRTEDNRSDLLGLTLQATSEQLGRHVFNYGIDVYSDKVSSSRQELTTTTGVLENISSRFPDGSRLSNYDIYFHDQVYFGSNTHLDAGIRVSNARVQMAATDSSIAADINNTDVSGSIGLRYAFTDEFDGVANLARGFRSPNIFDLGTLGARPGNRFNIANPSLSPETVVTAELGGRFKRNDFSLDMVVWGSDYQDKITSVFTGAQTESGRDIVQSQNASKVELSGAELSGQWDFNKYNQISANLNYTKGETVLGYEGKEPADRIPPLNGRLAWRYSKRNWWLNSELMFAGNQDRLSARDIRDPRINPLGTSGWGALNIAWGMDITHSWQVITRLENLLDKPYRRHGSGADASGRHIKISLIGRL